MASNKRTCEQCGGFSSPHIPRQRVDGRMLCKGCAARELAKTAAKSGGSGARRKPRPLPQHYDFWDGDLAPREDLHPLQQPLPNSVWERFAQHRLLLGKPKVFLDDHLDEAEKRGGDPDPIPGSKSDQKRQTKTAADILNGAHNLPAGEKLIQHLQDHHGMTFAQAYVAGSSGISEHLQLHQGPNDHKHGPNGEVLPAKALTDHGPGASEDLAGGSKTKHLPHPQGPNELTMHLLDHHGMGDWETADMDHNDLVDQHEQFHHNTAYSGDDAPNHTHDDGVAQKETVSEESEGPEQLKHPSKYTNSSLHTHLLEDHGIHPDHMENAINGTFEGTDPSHVVHMLHNAAHENGQAEFDHTHEDWSGPPHVHPGHKDVGKPFWGAPPVSVQKLHDHLMESPENGGHGVTQEDLPDTWHLSDEDARDALVAHHGNLHGADDAGELSHQHVPTAQPGVKSPKQIKKEQLQQHLKDYHGVDQAKHPEMVHGELHDPDAFYYKGHPGHEHTPDNVHGPVTTTLPTKYPGVADQTGKPYSPGHHEHPASMSHQDLVAHMQTHHEGFKNGNLDPDSDLDAFFNFSLHEKSHEELLQQHALQHATGETSGHTHEPVGYTGPLEDPSIHYGNEPEVQTDTHPHMGTDSEALAHILQHHPNVSSEHLDEWKKSHHSGAKPSMVQFHDALHTPGYKTSTGNTLPKVMDGHDHEDPMGVPTTIAIGHHLVTEHGVDKDKVAAMTPEEFKAHHEQLHIKESEFDIGHGHTNPGGPTRDPRITLPNTHHQQFRTDDRHPAAQEWYHGTATDYDGAPKNATELKEDHGFWGNFGGGDWNNHVGSHWTSLHQMAANFNGTSNRVIHAKLHIANPVTYNSLNHMSHDAYDRLHESGHLQDDGQFYKNHHDDTGYDTGDECCAGRLLEYAKGHHRSDGKFGVEAYRDSLRASGYDGIHVRNQADSPKGHWNAIPLSADQIEITHGGCRGEHGDERDKDVREFENNRNTLLKDWDHPKPFNHKDYMGQRLDHLPSDEEVQHANATKASRPTTNKTAEGRGDSDKYLSFDPDLDTGDDEEHFCEHCDDMTDHQSDDCTVSKYCTVCEEHGDHEAKDEHDLCDKCDDYADHDTDSCDKNPDNWSKETYCPHCDTKNKDNEHASECVNCGKKLPDWGSLQTYGKPVKPEDYRPDGEADEVSYGSAANAKRQGGTTGEELAQHLYHHHKSDLGGPEFDDKGDWDEAALSNHHQWLHHNPEEAKAKGFEVDHSHKQVYGQFKQKMTPEETHAHLLLAHTGKSGGIAPLSVKNISAMTPQEAVEAHKKAHAADDAVHWGQKDSEGDLTSKITHTHNLDDDPDVPGEKHFPQGDQLLSHLGDKKFHLSQNAVTSLKSTFDKNPGVAEALHKQMHANFGPSAEPGTSNWHVHGPELDKQIADHQGVLDHLTQDHGVQPSLLSNKDDLNALMEAHKAEHTSTFPKGNDPDHVHFGGTNHLDPEGHSAATMKAKQAEPEPESPKAEEKFPELKSTPVHGLLNSVDSYAMEDHLHYHHPDVPETLQHSEGFDYAPGTPKFKEALKEAHEAHMKAHAEGADHDHGGTALAKESSRRTLTDLFEEVAS